MSKVFVGYVNGRKYNNKQDFDQAVSKAVDAGHDLNIVSYYQEVSDNKEVEKICDCDNCNKQPEPVRVEYSDLFPTLSFELSDELLGKLKTISDGNREELLERLHTDFDDYTNRKTSIKTNIEYLESRIEKLNKKLYEYKTKLTSTNEVLDYFDRVADVIDNSKRDNKDIKCSDENCSCNKKSNTSGSSLLDDSFLDKVLEKSPLTGDFYKFMKNLGFI